LDYVEIYDNDWDDTNKYNDNPVNASLYGLLYDPIRITIDGVEAIDVTDYLAGESGFTSGTADNEFYIHGNKVYFNRSITSTITVEYWALGDTISFRAKLYRNSNTDEGLTPVVDRVVLRLATDRQRNRVKTNE
jgi:hypothetical protein